MSVGLWKKRVEAKSVFGGKELEKLARRQKDVRFQVREHTQLVG